MVGFLKETVVSWHHRKQLLVALLLVVGTFAPWLAIDVLWFDDFFLMQAYVICGLSMGYDDTSDDFVRI
jgi:hypothetical protein